MESYLSYVIHNANDMRLEKTSFTTLKEDEVLIKVLYASICATDIELYDGSMPYYEQGLSKRPLIPGHEWSGTVVKKGSNVCHLPIGALVVGDISIGCGQCENCLRGIYHLCDNRKELGVIDLPGSFAQYLVTKAKNVYIVPDGITAEEASLIEPAATALNAVRRVSVSPGDTVVVYGDGTIGILCAQIANVCGASKIIVVGLKDDHQALLSELNCCLVNAGHTDLHKSLESIIGGKADVVIEATGNPTALGDAIKTVKPGGKLCAVSITGKTTIPVDMDYIVTRDITVYGVLASPNAFKPTLDLMAAGKINVKPLITRVFDFEEVIEAFNTFKLNKQPRIKYLVKVAKD